MNPLGELMVAADKIILKSNPSCSQCRRRTSVSSSEVYRRNLGLNNHGRDGERTGLIKVSPIATAAYIEFPKASADIGFIGGTNVEPA